MAILPIYTYGDAVLKKVAKPIKKVDDKIQKLIDDMFETMAQANGIGLAAPQVGVSIRLMVVDVSCVKECKHIPPMVIINPQILETKGEVLMEEGCLSIPGVREEVWRPEIIKLKYRDRDFKERIEEFDGLVSRVIQHELDHLNGELFVEKLDSKTRRELKEELEAIKRGEAEAAYVLAEK
ncbi:MAG: peptide deformylase [Chloroherpetonaceae bacterium]|nr:peptide deformylase [Chloroherpetonaceae bacterium]MDW8438118.1 peptide deformylase [Chloroherpetonaceae bacterium]